MSSEVLPIDDGVFDSSAKTGTVEQMIVKIKIYLNTDGSLLKPPEVVQHERMNKPSEKYFRTLAESALRAVRRCDPIKVPDVERYENWKNLQLNFDPREILRG